MLDAIFMRHKAIITAKRDQIARDAIKADIKLLFLNTVVIPHYEWSTRADINATLHLPEEKVTVKLPVLN